MQLYVLPQTQPRRLQSEPRIGKGKLGELQRIHVVALALFGLGLALYARVLLDGVDARQAELLELRELVTDSFECPVRQRTVFWAAEYSSQRGSILDGGGPSLTHVWEHGMRGIAD